MSTPTSAPPPAPAAGSRTKPNLTGVSSTTLVTLAARANDALRANSLLRDTVAAATLAQLDWECPRTNLDNAFYTTILVRAQLLDAWVVEFLESHPQATVLHLGCGLDSRAHRLAAHWGAGVRWVDIDLPAVVELRKQVIPLPETTGDYELVGTSVTEDAWLEAVPSDRQVLVVGEGLLMYLDPPDARRLVQRIVDRFPGGQFMFDIPGKWFLRMQRLNRPISRTGAVMTFAIDDAHEIEAWNPKIRARTVLRMWQVPGKEIFPWYLRLLFWFYSCFPGLRTWVSYMRYDF